MKKKCDLEVVRMGGKGGGRARGAWIWVAVALIASLVMWSSVGYSSIADTSGSISSETIKKWESFKIRYGSNWSVIWNYKTEASDLIYGSSYNMKMGMADSENKAEEIAKVFVSDNQDFLGVDLSALKLAKVERSNKKWYVTYQQYYNGIPVNTGEVGMTLSDNGDIILAGSDFYPKINVDAIPKFSKNDAINIAKNDAPTLNNVNVKNVELVIFSKETNDSINYHLAWRADLFSEDPLWGKVSFIDAHDGSILNEYSTIAEAKDNKENMIISKSNLIVIALIFIILVLLFIKKRTPR